MTSSTRLKYCVPSCMGDHSRAAKASTSTALVAPILIYRCVIRTSEGWLSCRIAGLRARCNLGEKLVNGGDRQPDHVCIRAVHARNESRGQALDRVRASLVAPFFAR